jgi:hypothetical protein
VLECLPIVSAMHLTTDTYHEDKARTVHAAALSFLADAQDRLAALQARGCNSIVSAAITLGMAVGGCGGKVGDTVGMQVGGSGGTGGDTAGDGTPVELESLPSAVARALCEGLATCCKSIGQVVDVAACQSRMQRQIGFPAASATTRYDPTLGGQCIADIRSAMASCYTLDDTPACEAMFAGTVAPGGVCNSSSDCAQPPGGYASCVPSAAGVTSVCTAGLTDQHGAPGQSCSGTCTSDSNGSAACSGMAVRSGESGPPAGAGSCYTNDRLYCAPETYTCQALVALGGHCADYSACVDTAKCDTATEQCVPKAALGAACSYSAECSPGAYCDANRTCQTKKSDGQTCDSGSAYDECIGYCLSADEASGGICASGRERFVPTPTLCQNPSLG